MNLDWDFSGVTGCLIVKDCKLLLLARKLELLLIFVMFYMWKNTWTRRDREGTCQGRALLAWMQLRYSCFHINRRLQSAVKWTRVIFIYWIHFGFLQCFFPQNVVQNIQTPMFILNTAYDVWQVFSHPKSIQFVLFDTPMVSESRFIVRTSYARVDTHMQVSILSRSRFSSRRV